MKPTFARKLGLMLVLAALFLGLSGCTDPEAAARKMQNDAITAEKEGRRDDATKIYEDIVAEYPQTQAAVEANKSLLAASRLEIFHEAKDAKLLELQTKDIANILDLFRLENGRYPSTEEGLEALITRPAGYPRWNGPYVKDPESARRMFQKFVYTRDASGNRRIEPK